jgi:hypothetical protein
LYGLKPYSNSQNHPADRQGEAAEQCPAASFLFTIRAAGHCSAALPYRLNLSADRSGLRELDREREQQSST